MHYVKSEMFLQVIEKLNCQKKTGDFIEKSSFLGKKIFFSMDDEEMQEFTENELFSECFDEIDGIDECDIENLLDKTLVDTGTIEAFCVWDGSVVIMSFPTSATGWERIHSNSVGKTSQIRWRYYDNSLQIVCKHRSCIGTPRPTNMCENCKMRDKWRKGCTTPHEIFFIFHNDQLPAWFPLLIQRKITIPEEIITRYLEILPSPIVKTTSPNKCRKTTTKSTTDEILINPSISRQHTQSHCTKIEESLNAEKYKSIQNFYSRIVEGIQNQRIQKTKDIEGMTVALTRNFLQIELSNSILLKTSAFDSFLSDIAKYESFIYINTSFFTWLLQKIHNEMHSTIRIGFEKGDQINDLLSTDMIPAIYNSSVKVLSKKLSTLCKSGENALISIICGECEGDCLTIGPHRESTMPIGIVKIL